MFNLSKKDRHTYMTKQNQTSTFTVRNLVGWNQIVTCLVCIRRGSSQKFDHSSKTYIRNPYEEIWSLEDQQVMFQF